MRSATGAPGCSLAWVFAAREADVTLTITALDLDFEAHDWEPEARRALLHFKSVQVDGVVVSTPLPGIDVLLADWDPAIPLMTVSELRADDGSAGTHSHAAGWEATRHLIGLGHRDIIHVAGPETRNEAGERERGYRDAMEDAGLCPTVIRAATDWTSVSRHNAGKLADPAAFSAVFAANDELALGFMSAKETRGAKAPEDYSIVGVDDMPAAAFFSPSPDHDATGLPGAGNRHVQDALSSDPHRRSSPALHRRAGTCGSLVDSASHSTLTWGGHDPRGFTALPIVPRRNRQAGAWWRSPCESSSSRSPLPYRRRQERCKSVCVP